MAALWGKSILYDIQTYHPTPIARKAGIWGNGRSLKADAVAVDEFYRSDRAADVPNQENTMKFMNRINPLRHLKVYEYDEFNSKIRYRDNFVLLGIQYNVVDSDLETMLITNDLMSKLYELVAYSVFNRVLNEYIDDCCNVAKLIKYDTSIRDQRTENLVQVVNQFKLTMSTIANSYLTKQKRIYPRLLAWPMRCNDKNQ
ncbi:MAG: hypothetical protein KAH18_04855 [Psychromonas sp.]|nr:hypothetical protein [Psychromonas sp.]